MTHGLLSLYSPRYAAVLVYMLQATEYQAGPYLRWYWRVRDFSTVRQRRQLVRTRAANLLLVALAGGMLLQVMSAIALLAAWGLQDRPLWQPALVLLVSYPVVWAHLVVLPLWLGRWLIVRPRQRRSVRRAERIFAAHPGVKVAVAGSYGKTSMKELLTTVLSEGCKVAATPANLNVAVSHARFAQSLDGDEAVLVLEYGEGRPGDVARFAELTHPTDAVITGLAPAHLDTYKTLAAAGLDIFSVRQYVMSGHVYVNGDSPATHDFMTKDMLAYGAKQALGWKISGVKLSADGTSFNMKLGKRKLALQSGLLGRHQVGPLAFAAAFALQLGLTEEQVAAGIARTRPYEHRMQPYVLSGATIIDDTYNGNLEGVRAGTALLRELPARRKWYITPGLVDQGRDVQRIHVQMGEHIAAAKPDVVVLMRNSVTPFIEAGLRAGTYKGELRIEDDPLQFYNNLKYFVASGDLVMMQNDWTDNYA